MPLATAEAAVIKRNGIDAYEGRLLKYWLRRALGAMQRADRKACSLRLVRQARFISVNANNHLAIRVPAWSDAGYRIDGDMILISPQAERSSVLSASAFRRVSSSRFKLIPHFNLVLSWEELAAMTPHDWAIFRHAYHDALTLARTRRWTSNILLP
jgi:hypothetical protein